VNGKRLISTSDEDNNWGSVRLIQRRKEKAVPHVFT
jgi:hypothetical protein